MRKIFKNMAWTMAATLVMAACSDSLDESSGNGNSNEFIGDKGYVNIGINLPTTPSTRSESFDDGKAEEYKVDKVIIALFYGGTEKEAECKCAFQLTDKDFLLSDDATNNITSYYATGVRMIPAPDANVYALAIVNPTSKFTISGNAATGEDTGDAVLSTNLNVDGVTGKITLAALNSAVTIDNIDDVTKKATSQTSDYFLMTNAPIANKTSFNYTESPTLTGDNAFEVTTLAPITVYNDRALAEGAAKDNPIYVERVVAKTEVKIGNNGQGNNPDSDNTLLVTSNVTSYQGAKVTFEGWKLQNTNKKYFPVRKVTDETIDDWQEWAKLQPTTSISTSTNRFFGNQSGPYRTYWGIDPNYNNTHTSDANDYNVYDYENNTIAAKEWNSVGHGSVASEIEYCLENTTTAQRMVENRLTSVLLKGIFKPKAVVDNPSSNYNFFMINNTSAIYTEEEFLKVATAALKDGNALSSGQTLVLKSGLKSGLNITSETTETVEGNLLEINGGNQLTTAQGNAILEAAGGNIKFYLNGVTYYYATVIKHFGDVETPLGDDESITSVDKYNDANHLGRYGVLRNNWYELTITSVKGPGEPEIPEIPVTPPDKKESYINCEINILSWAKRSQGVDL